MNGFQTITAQQFADHVLKAKTANDIICGEAERRRDGTCHYEKFQITAVYDGEESCLVCMVYENIPDNTPIVAWRSTHLSMLMVMLAERYQ